MADRRVTVDSPVEKQQFKPGDAASLPTKSYPSSTKMATKGKPTTVDSPCEGKKEY